MAPESKLLGPPVTVPPPSVRPPHQASIQNPERQSIADKDREQDLKRQSIADKDREQDLKQQRTADGELERERIIQRNADERRAQEFNTQRILFEQMEPDLKAQRIAEAVKREDRKFKQIFFQRLMQIGLVVTLLIFVSGIGVLYIYINPKFHNIFIISIGSFVAILATNASVQFLTKTRNAAPSSLINLQRNPDSLSTLEERLSKSINQLRDQVHILRARQDSHPSLYHTEMLTTEERTNLVNNIHRHFIEDEIKNSMDRLAKEKENLSSRHLIFIREKNSQELDRLMKEISDLNNKAIYNLIIGVVTTIGALGLLAYVAITAKENLPDTKSILFHYLPRLSIVIFAEIFAFFFLKNYRNNLDGIRYFHNEISNIEAKGLAVELAYYADDKTMLNGVIDSLAKTERNFRLQKDETTPDIEQSKIEANGIKEILGSLATILQKSKGS